MIRTKVKSISRESSEKDLEGKLNQALEDIQKEKGFLKVVDIKFDAKMFPGDEIVHSAWIIYNVE